MTTLVLECRLECDQGYSYEKMPVIACLKGRWSDVRGPESFFCKTAVALVITSSGEAAIFSDQNPRCSQKITNRLPSSVANMAVNMVNDYIVVVGYDRENDRSVAHTLEGLKTLTNPWITQTLENNKI